MEFCNFLKAPFGKFSDEHPQISLGSFSFNNKKISVEHVRNQTRPSPLTFFDYADLKLTNSIMGDHFGAKKEKTKWRTLFATTKLQSTEANRRWTWNIQIQQPKVE